MQVRLVTEVAPLGGGFRPEDKTVWEGPIETPDVAPPIRVVVWSSRTFEFAAKLNGVYIYREVQCLVISNG